ncbi:GIY-YIG nuclease family protein [bacterium]|nr:GIY-YIG nuclease family protein [bacterium]
MRGFVYILQSGRNGRYYIGSTNNIDRRFKEHVEGIVKATCNLRPLLLVFQQEYKTLLEARRVERKLKRFKRKDIIKRIIKEKEIFLTGD